MVDIAKLSAAKLHALIAKRDAAHFALLHETIAAGYGDTRGNEISRLAREDRFPLLVEYEAAREALSEARAELDARRRYQGTDKPIKRPTYA